MTSKYPTIPNNILSDLCTRFVMNVPDVESDDVIRIFFQVELAHWFFLDFYCQEDSRVKPCTLKEFCFIVVNYCPTLSRFREHFEEFYESWKNYKQAVPTYGAILLDPTLQYCLLVQGYWFKSSWSFAKGKVNQDEAPIACAVREVQEETGFNIEDRIDPDNFLEKKLNEQTCRLYIVHGVPMDTSFKAQTRSEIKGISWFDVDLLPAHKKDLVCRNAYQLNPNLFFTAIPFIKDLRNRIHQMKSQNFNSLPPTTPPSSPFVATLSRTPSSLTQAAFFSTLLDNSTPRERRGNSESTQAHPSQHPPTPLPPSTPHLPPTPHLPSTQPLFPTSHQSTASCIYSQPIKSQHSNSTPHHPPSTTTPHHPPSTTTPHQPPSKQRSASDEQDKNPKKAHWEVTSPPNNTKDIPANGDYFEGDYVIPPFFFQAPAWDSFQINLESVMASIFAQ